MRIINRLIHASIRFHLFGKPLLSFCSGTDTVLEMRLQLAVDQAGLFLREFKF